MRRIFIILLIALLPLRGWAGGVMAVDMLAQNGLAHAMAPQNQDATTLIAIYAETIGTYGHFELEISQIGAKPALDCAGHEAMAHDMQNPPADHGDSPTDHCQKCDVCQICHTVALAPSAMLHAAQAPLQTFTPALGLRLASAVLATGLKPPIS